MKASRISLVVFILLAFLLMNSIPASAGATRIDYYAIGGDTCAPVLDPPRLSGPNMHIHGTYTCSIPAYDMEGNLLPIASGTVYWTDAYNQTVDGHSIITAKFRFVTIEGGVFEGSLVWAADGILKGVSHGEGMYKGIHRFATYNPAVGMETGYILFTP